MGKKVDIIYKLQYIVADNSVKIEFFNTDNNASSDIFYQLCTKWHLLSDSIIVWRCSIILRGGIINVPGISGDNVFD